MKKLFLISLFLLIGCGQTENDKFMERCRKEMKQELIKNKRPLSDENLERIEKFCKLIIEANDF